MVKNKQGGKNAKRMARKDAAPVASARIRVPEDDLEEIAIVTRIFGGCLVEVITYTGKQLQCRIRGKFSGRSMRRNFVTRDSVLLVGLRDWEAKPSMCDMLMSYAPHEVQQLKELPKFATHVLQMLMSVGADERIAGVDESELIFTADGDGDDSDEGVLPQKVPLTDCPGDGDGDGDEYTYSVGAFDKITLDDV